MHNHKKFCNAFDPDRPPDCMCHLAPRSWRRTRQFDGHFLIVPNEYKGPGRNALQCSHKSPVEITNADVFAEIYKGLQNMKRTLPAVMQLGATDDLIKEITKTTVKHYEAELRHSPTHSHDQPVTLVTKTDVMNRGRGYARYARYARSPRCSFFSSTATKLVDTSTENLLRTVYTCQKTVPQELGTCYTNALRTVLANAFRTVRAQFTLKNCVTRVLLR